MFRVITLSNKNKLLLVSFCLLLQMIFGFIFIRFVAYRDITNSLLQLQNRIKNDLQIKNGQWDTTLYNADPLTPHPSGSNGYAMPLYIITSSGFIIERNQPISGLLDSADFKHMNAFLSPQSLAIVTNDRWRVLSRAIKSADKEVIGLISVAYHNPNDSILDVIDLALQDNLEKINSSISIKGGNIDVSRVDVRQIRYDISFEIINSYNKVLLHNGRTPTFIDPSYVEDELRNEDIRIVKDMKTANEFLVSKLAIKDDRGNTQGVVLVGQSLKSVNEILKAYLISTFIFSSLIVIPFIMWISGKKPIKTKSYLNVAHPKSLSFNAKEGFIYADEKEISIPYATNQYNLCKALFTYPKKRWELDELLVKFGELPSSKNWRIVYDAAVLVNKRVGFKLVVYADKTYRLNSRFVKK